MVLLSGSLDFSDPYIMYMFTVTLTTVNFKEKIREVKLGQRVAKIGGMEGSMGTVRSGPEAGNSALRLVDEFAAFGPCYMKWVKSRLGSCGVTYARMRLLGTLHCNGPQIMSDISGELGVTRRNVTALVDALEEEGLVRRMPHPSDRRATLIELTEKGMETTDGAYDGHRTGVAEVFAGLSEDEQQVLIRLMGSLREALRQEGFSC
jgi:DNA-binding MarR family transcriptional regulator